ncbi:MAG TPA: xanthine dehydrogenase family protein molybdopterin-binding subunit [Dehalococcoidia bacterium]|nr:xanthine dehydrogenase family protein molybdopterin-binding subunit [Dehalococcoidia bacterium]
MAIADQPQYRVIGTNRIRPDGLDKVTGRAQFGDDFHLPGMLHGRILRSPHAHARIKRIDVSRALELPGVRAVATAQDIPPVPEKLTASGEAGLVNMQDVADNLLARDKTLYHGHPVAAVAADSPHIAEEALNLIAVEYEVLQPVMSPTDALREDAPVIHEKLIPGSFIMKTEKVAPNAGRLQLKIGDVDAGFAEADFVVEREFTTAMVHQGYIESHNATAIWDEQDNITIWTSTQGAFTIRDLTAGILQVPQSKVKVIPMEIGGGFGGKDMTFFDPVAAILSKKTGRPVKIIMNRAEVLRATGPSSGTYMKIKMGAKKDGSITAADLWFAFEAGAYSGGPIAPASLTSVTRYNIPNARLEGYDVVVNKPKVRPYRAPGSTQSQWAVESVIDELAEKVGMDPVDFRLKNVAKEGDRTMVGMPLPRIGGVEVLEAVKNHPHYKAPLGGPNRGRGVGFAFWFGAGIMSSCHIAVNSDGTVNISTGSCDLSGTRMTLAMQAAETLGIDPEDIDCIVADTDSVGYTFQSVGSRTTFATGWAVIQACQDIIKQMTERVAKIWDTTEENVWFANGTFRSKSDMSKEMTFKENAEMMLATGGPIVASASVDPKGVGPQVAANIIDVEVDPETGKVEIIRATAIQDAGKAIHPDYVAGQMQGGLVQGVGWALNEEYWYDSEGHMVNASLLDYRMPTSLDVPMIDTVIIEVPNPGHPYGVRGVGEVSIVPPPAAVANAIHNAIGVRMSKLPMNPGNVLEALWEQKGK